MTHTASQHDSQKSGAQESGASEIESLKTSLLPKLADVNRKVDDMRTATHSDPENLTDKIIKLALPALAGLVLSKVLEMAWKKTTKNDVVPSGSDDTTSLLGAMAFASVSAALAAVVSRLSTKGSTRLVNRRISKREEK